MEIHNLTARIIPERAYSVSEAARYLGVHRCTIYAYISHPQKPLPFTRQPNKTKLLFHGSDLIAYKTAGLPKKGRKRKNGMQYCGMSMCWSTVFASRQSEQVIFSF